MNFSRDSTALNFDRTKKEVGLITDKPLAPIADDPLALGLIACLPAKPASLIK